MMNTVNYCSGPPINLIMRAFFFKTNIASSDQIEAIRDRLNQSLGFREWSFDLEHPNKIFKVEVLTTSPKEIIDLLEELGVNCIEILLQ